MSRNGKIHTKKRQLRQMPDLAFLNQRLFLQPHYAVKSDFVIPVVGILMKIRLHIESTVGVDI